MKYYTLLCGCLIFNVAAALLLKMGAGSPPSPLLLNLLSLRAFIGLFLYGLSALLYIQALKLGTLSLSQSIMGIQYGAILLAAHFLLGESLSPVQIGGCLLVGTGILLIVNGG